MPRARHQNGWVERTGKKTKTWTGYWYEYAREESGSEKRLQRSKVLGPCSELSKGAAEDKLREILREERPPQTNATFEQLALWYLKTNQGRWSKKMDRHIAGYLQIPNSAAARFAPGLGTEEE